jgi:hypothetical protein
MGRAYEARSFDGLRKAHMGSRRSPRKAHNGLFLLKNPAFFTSK